MLATLDYIRKIFC